MMSPRAADDFSTIRARLKELRHKRAPQSSETQDGAVLGPKPNQSARMNGIEPESHRLPRPVRQKLFG
jgi:hypothetical protein